MKILAAFDELFKDVAFDTAFYKKFVHNNIEFITKKEHIDLFGSKLIGCFYTKYTMYDKNILYGNLVDMEAEDLIDTISKITSIPSHFKIARDDVNLFCFYVAHKFLTNPDLAKDKQREYAKEALNYFSYRTLVLTSSDYFVYPISEEKALSLSERLSNRYILKKLKNWNEYCIYRSDEFLQSKFLEVLISFNKDDKIVDGITDLYNRTKDTLKNIYDEFTKMIASDEIIKSKKGVVNDIEGESVILDKLNSADSYFIKIEGLLIDKQSFIRKEFIDVTIDIVNSVSHKQLEDTLRLITEYSYTGRDKHDEVKKFYQDVLVNAIDYLQRNEVFLAKNTNLITAVNSIVGNVLYARGTDISINKLKEEGEQLLKRVYKHQKYPISERSIRNLRNGVYVYIVIIALLA